MQEVVGVVPAAGLATRMPKLPCSKEVFPVGFRADDRGSVAPKPMGLYVLEQMIRAGVSRVMFVIRQGKWDIPGYFGDGRAYGVETVYLVQEMLLGLPYALDLARPWLRDELILFGMPDTIILPDDAGCQLVARHRTTGADVTLAAFPTLTPERFGMVEIDDRGRLIRTVDKPAETELEYMWGMACWGVRFSAYMAEYLASIAYHDREVVLSSVLQAATDNGLDVRVVTFPQGKYIDVGTAYDLVNAVRSEGEILDQPGA